MKEILPYLDTILLMTLGTVDADGNSWSSTVYFANDAEGNLYFISKLGRNHSQHILQKSTVSCAIVDQTQEPSVQKCGLQISGTAEALAGTEAKSAFDLFISKHSFFGTILEHINFTGENADSLERIWKITPLKVRIWDEAKYGGDGLLLE